MEIGNIKFSRLKESNDEEEAETHTNANSALGRKLVTKRRTLMDSRWKSICVVLAFFSIVLVISFNRRDINYKYGTIVHVLNHSSDVQNSYKSELQKVGAKVNIAWSNLTRIGKENVLLCYCMLMSFMMKIIIINTVKLMK